MRRTMLAAMMMVVAGSGAAQAQTAYTPPSVVVGPTEGARIDTPGMYEAAPCCPPAMVASPPAAYSYRPLFALRPMPTSYEVGRGVLGQPKVYVSGQPVRNFVRYLTP
jgi:hypothetical protein